MCEERKYREECTKDNLCRWSIDFIQPENLNPRMIWKCLPKDSELQNYEGDETLIEDDLDDGNSDSTRVIFFVFLLIIFVAVSVHEACAPREERYPRFLNGNTFFHWYYE